MVFVIKIVVEAEEKPYEDLPKRISPIVVYGGATCKSSSSEACASKLDQQRCSILGESRPSLAAQVEFSRQRYDLDRFSILPVS